MKLVLDHQEDHEYHWAAIISIAEKIGCSRKALRKWVRQAERDAGKRVFSTDGARPPTEEMVKFIDEQREIFGVGPICTVIPIAPSTYYEQKDREADPVRVPPRARRDAFLRE